MGAGLPGPTLCCVAADAPGLEIAVVQPVGCDGWPRDDWAAEADGCSIGDGAEHVRFAGPSGARKAGPHPVEAQANCALCVQSGWQGGFAPGSAENPALSEQPPMEALSYIPVRFDDNATFDVERSSDRYSAIVTHSARARTQRRSRVWEDWLQGAMAGKQITLVRGFAEESDPLDDRSEVEVEPEYELPLEKPSTAGVSKVSANYCLDRSLGTLSIRAEHDDVGHHKECSFSISVDSIQVICPATDFMLFFDQVDTQLTRQEKGRAILLQYTDGGLQRKRVCLLEESDSARDRFIQALTTLWLEKRSDHSMWF